MDLKRLRWSVQDDGSGEEFLDPTAGRSKGSAQSERPKRGDRANAFRSLGGGQRHAKAGTSHPATMTA